MGAMILRKELGREPAFQLNPLQLSQSEMSRQPRQRRRRVLEQDAGRHVHFSNDRGADRSFPRSVAQRSEWADSKAHRRSWLRSILATTPPS